MKAPRPLHQLYQRWLRHRLPPAREQTLNQRRIFIFPTRYGFLFLLVSGACFLGGINYENNLIIGFAFLLVGIFIVAILHTFRNLAGLTIKAGRQESGFSGQKGSLQVMLAARDNHSHRSLYLSWPNGSRGEISVDAGEEQSLWLSVPLPGRGRIHPGRLRIESQYPMGMIFSWSLVDLDHYCLAWPRPFRSEECPASGGEKNEGQHTTIRGSEDFYGLRTYVAGDALSQVDWKSYARGRDLQTKMFMDPVEGWLWLEWDQLTAVDPELRLSYLCWWVLEFDRQSRPFGMRLPGISLSPDASREHTRKALDILARWGQD